jgi:hypothetical protein
MYLKITVNSFYIKYCLDSLNVVVFQKKKKHPKTNDTTTGKFLGSCVCLISNSCCTNYENKYKNHRNKLVIIINSK